MNKTESFLSDFEAIARSFDAALEVNIEMSIGRTRGIAYQELLVRAAAPGQIQGGILAKGRDKAEAMTDLTNKLRTKYAPAGMVPLASDEAKRAVLQRLNHPLMDRNTKVTVLLNINRMTQAQAEAKVAQLDAKILHLENRPYSVVGEVIHIKPAA